MNAHEIITGDFTRNTEFRIPGEDLKVALTARLKERVQIFDASELARIVLGDSIYSNMILLGAAWQLGQVPLSGDALREAIKLNGAKVSENLRAFDYGRWAALNGDEVARLVEDTIVPLPKSLEEQIAFRASHLERYQSARLAKTYRKMVDGIADPDLKRAVAKGYHKLLAYKDEYEVARLLMQSEEKAKEAFDGDLKLTYHLAPPILGGTDATGRPKKRAFGGKMAGLFPLLAKMKMLRGTPFDVFGYSAERRMERRLIKQYRKDMTEVLADPQRNLEAAIALAELPLSIRGFGPVKEANAAKAEKTRSLLLEAFRTGETEKPSAAA